MESKSRKELRFYSFFFSLIVSVFYIACENTSQCINSDDKDLQLVLEVIKKRYRQAEICIRKPNFKADNLKELYDIRLRNINSNEVCLEYFIFNRSWYESNKKENLTEMYKIVSSWPPLENNDINYNNIIIQSKTIDKQSLALIEYLDDQLNMTN